MDSFQGVDNFLHVFKEKQITIVQKIFYDSFVCLFVRANKKQTNINKV